MTDRIEINPLVMHGRPIIRGTRVPVEVLLRKLGQGATFAELMDAYLRLTALDVQAALSYAADTIAHEVIYSECKLGTSTMRFLADECCDPQRRERW